MSPRDFAGVEECCSICREPLQGYGHWARPINGGRCCDRCNGEFVIPARLRRMRASRGKQTSAPPQPSCPEH